MLIKDPPVPVTDSLLMLGTNEYPLYLVKGKSQNALFEGGTAAMAPVLQQQLRQLDIAPESVRQLVITHAHPDHVMAVPALRRILPNIEVSASQEAAATLSAEKAVAFFSKIDSVLTESLISAGAITDEHRPRPLEKKQIPVDRVLEEGDTITVDGFVFKTVKTPGHSDCSLSFHEPVASILIISDATGYYVPEHNYFWPNYFANYAAYLDSIKRLAVLGADILCLSHNAVIKGARAVKTYIDTAISATENYHRRIIAETKAGNSPQQIAETLGAEVYERTKLLPVEFFQKNCSLLVKQSLKHEGLKPKK